MEIYFYISENKWVNADACVSRPLSDFTEERRSSPDDEFPAEWSGPANGLQLDTPSTRQLRENVHQN